MYAVVTGASSGIGREIAKLLARRGYDLIVVARRKERLEKLKVTLEQKYQVNVVTKQWDLSKEENCYRFFAECKSYPVRILVNSAGFGKVGKCEEIPLEEEIDMIKTNIISTHILTKLFVKHMRRGRILNVASIAGFQPGPIMTTYGATKSYVIQFSRALNYELKRDHRKVRISLLCPGPVRTEFDQVANSDFNLKYITAERCAKIAVDGLFRNKELIIPDLSIKLLRIASKLTPTKIILPMEYWIQSRKKS